jgi:hypothetical protein
MMGTRLVWCVAIIGFLGVFGSGSRLAQADQTALIKAIIYLTHQAVGVQNDPHQALVAEDV